MRRLVPGIALLFMLTMTVLTGCGEPKQGETPADRTEINVFQAENVISPKEINVRANEKIRFFVTNGGAKAHTFTNDAIGLTLNIEANKTSYVDWQAPAQLGDYPVSSMLNGKAEDGITMTIHVIDENAKNIQQNQQDMQNIAPEQKQ